LIHGRRIPKSAAAVVKAAVNTPVKTANTVVVLKAAANTAAGAVN
jgi:hypothetical protein